MQLQSLLIMLFVMAVIPIMILSSNHEIFFVLMTIVLLFSSIKNLNKFFKGKKENIEESDNEMEEEFEEMLNIDMEKFGLGIDIAKNLIIILFLIYCAFFLSSLLFKTITALAIMLQIHFINARIKLKAASAPVKIHGISTFLSNTLNLAVIILVLFNKLTGSKY